MWPPFCICRGQRDSGAIFLFSPDCGSPGCSHDRQRVAGAGVGRGDLEVSMPNVRFLPSLFSFSFWLRPAALCGLPIASRRFVTRRRPNPKPSRWISTTGFWRRIAHCRRPTHRFSKRSKPSKPRWAGGREQHLAATLPLPLRDALTRSCVGRRAGAAPFGWPPCAPRFGAAVAESKQCGATVIP